MWLHVGDEIDYLLHVGNNAPFGNEEEEEKKMILVNKIIHISLVFLRSRLVRKCVRALLWNKAFKRNRAVCAAASLTAEECPVATGHALVQGAQPWGNFDFSTNSVRLRWTTTCGGSTQYLDKTWSVINQYSSLSFTPS